jgi:hypothetical protein
MAENSTLPTPHQLILCKHTTLLPGIPKEIKIQNTRFIIITNTTLLYNGKSIEVVIHYFSDYSLCVEFIDVFVLRKIIGPIHFIQLNKIYVFDINLNVDDLDHLYFSTKSIKEIIHELEEFIETTNGKIVKRDEHNEWLMVKCENKTLVTFNILTMDVENGFIVELSSTLKYPYQKEYTQYAKIFDIYFIPPIIQDDSYKQLFSF